MREEQQKKRKSTILILLLLLVIIGLCLYIFFGNKKEENKPTQKLEQGQAEYVKPEEPIDRSKNVTLPGWGGFTIPANKKTITEGFEFHNPAQNYWYEDWISINGKKLEKLVVDSGNRVELDHYLKLAGISDKVVKVTDYDKKLFKITKTKKGIYNIQAIAGFKGKKRINVETDKDQKVTIEITCKSECYYMTFGLYLSNKDQLLYQSGLVSPGKYIQKMQMKQSLEAGTYDAYVICQPYRSDKKTKTNQGVVKITLTVK